MGSRGETGAYRALVANAGFRRLWAAQMVSRVGDSIHYVALVIFVFDLTGSGVSVSAAVIFEALPVVLLGAFAGALVDRCPRRLVMIVADLARAGLALLVARAGSVWEIYALAFGLSLGALVHTPSGQALLPNLVDEDHLGRANAALWSGVQSVHVMGSVIGGGLVAVAGPRGAFVVNAATFAASALLLAGLREPARQRPVESNEAGFVEQTRAGVSYAFGDRFLRRLLVVQFLAVLSVGGTGALLVVLAREQLGVDSTRFGVLVAAIGAGALLGPLLVGRILDRSPTTALLFVPYVIRGSIDAALAFLRGFWLPAGLLFIYGLNTSSGGVAYNTILQRRVPDQLRGRVFTTLGVTWQSGRLISIAAAGIIADAVSIQTLYVGAGALLILAGLLGLQLVPLANDQRST